MSREIAPVPDIAALGIIASRSRAIVALAREIDTGALHAHVDAPERPVDLRVGRGVANQVVVREIVGDPLQRRGRRLGEEREDRRLGL